MGKKLKIHPKTKQEFHKSMKITEKQNIFKTGNATQDPN